MLGVIPAAKNYDIRLFVGRKNPFKLISYLKFIFIFISYKANHSTKVNFKTSLVCLPRCFIATLFDIFILFFDYVSFTQNNANDARPLQVSLPQTVDAICIYLKTT
jgi:hypothetical protein